MENIVVGTEGLTRDFVLALYERLGWVMYTRDPDGLFRAILNSTYVVTIREGDRLIGLARCVSDDVAINYLQDILVLPEYQRTGIGRILLENCLERFDHVRTHVILTDNEERQRVFYESLGYTNTRDTKKTVLNCFVRMKGIELA